MSSERPEQAVLSSLGAEAQPLDFDTAYRRYAPYVGSIALRILGRHDDVDDVVQDVFLDAHRGLKDLRDPLAIKGWLARVTVRVSMRKLRTRRLRAFLRFDAPSDYEHIADAGASPETQTLLSRIYEKLDRLGADERVAWTLRFMQGEELEQVAVLTGASLATVKRRIARANDFIRGGDHG